MTLELELQNNNFRVITKDFSTNFLPDTRVNRKIVTWILRELLDNQGKRLFTSKQLTQILKTTNPSSVSNCVNEFRHTESEGKIFTAEQNLSSPLRVERKREEFRIVTQGFTTDWIVDTPTNRKIWMVVMRHLRKNQSRMFTAKNIAEIIQSNKQLVSIQMANFKQCAKDFAIFVSNACVCHETIDIVEQVIKQMPLATVKQITEHINLERENCLTHAQVKRAFRCIGWDKLRPSLIQALQLGEISTSQEYLLERLDQKIIQQPQVKAKSKKQLSTATASKLIEPEHPHINEKNQTSQQLFEKKDICCKSLATVWNSPLGWKLWALQLYIHGISTFTIGKWLGVNKSTISRWLDRLAECSIDLGKPQFSGKVAVDEKWIKIGKCFHYLFVAVDCVTGFPLHSAIFPANDATFCKLFLLELKKMGYSPKIIITDGWNAYPKAIADILPNAEHLLCRFHLIRSIFRRLRKAKISDKKISCAVSKLFKTLYKRTVHYRVDKLKQSISADQHEAVLSGLFTKLAQVIKAVGSSLRPSTANAAEQFFSQFDRLYRCKGPFANQKSAQKHLKLFLLGYLFTNRQNSNPCPLEKTGIDLSNVPFYHLINRPHVAMLKHKMTDSISAAT